MDYINLESVIFKNDEHEDNFTNIIAARMSSTDEFHLAAAYLLALPEIYPHFDSLFDTLSDSIKPDGLRDAWQTGSTTRACRLAFNLWNGYAWSNDGEEISADYSPYFLFCDSNAPYFWQAIKLRYPEYCE